jgi:hypothetical protein
MCGILATLFSSKKTSSTLFQNSLEKLRPRGPDATQNHVLNCGVVNPLFADIYMGFARLSINDLSIDGMQPMRLRFMKFGYEYSTVKLFSTSTGNMYITIPTDGMILISPPHLKHPLHLKHPPHLKKTHYIPTL